MFTPPAEVEPVTAAFASLFTRPSWQHAQALLVPANHVSTAALRSLGLAADPGFQGYHRLLNRARWSARTGAGVSLRLSEHTLIFHALGPLRPVLRVPVLLQTLTTAMRAGMNHRRGKHPRISHRLHCQQPVDHYP